MNAIWRPNVTVAAVVEREGRFLLVEEETDDGIRFNQPAGHLDAGESLIAACIRETLEETAWHFAPSALIGIYQWPRPAGDRPTVGPPQGGANKRMERSEHPSPPSSGRRRDFAEHCSAPPQPDGCAKPSVERGAGGWPPVTYLRFAFCGELGEHEADRALDTGILRALWLTTAEIEASCVRHRSPLVLQCVSDYLAGRRFPLNLIHHYVR